MIYYNNIRIVLSVSIILLVLPPLFAQQERLSSSDAQNNFFWATGNEFALYVLVGQDYENEQGFQMYLRRNDATVFLPGKWYRGKPTAIAAKNRRVQVFFKGGNSLSYDRSTYRTERRLPAGLTPIACYAANNKTHVLAVADREIAVALHPILFCDQDTIDLPKSNTELTSPSLPPQTDKPTRETDPAAAADTTDVVPNNIVLNKGQSILLLLEQGKEWVALSRVAMPIDSWRSTTIMVANDIVHVFGISELQNQTHTIQDNTQSALMYCQLKQGLCSKEQILSIAGVQSVVALSIEQQMYIVVAAYPEQFLITDTSQQDNALCEFRIAHYDNDTWTFTNPLQKTPDTLLLDPSESTLFATFGRHIAALQYSNDGQLHYATYTTEGTVIQEFTTTSLNAQDDHRRANQLQMAMGIIAIIVFAIVIIYRRSDAFTLTQPIPQYVQLAPLWRRLVAFALDLIPTIIFMAVVLAEMPEELTDPQSLAEQMNKGHYSMATIKWFFMTSICLTGYFIVCEVLLGTTPGKMVLRIVTLNIDGTIPKPRQMFLRNVLRFVELFAGIFILVAILITRRRQRIGDLLAKTMVVLKTPEMQQNVIRQMHKPPKISQPTNHTDSSDNLDNSDSPHNDEQHQGGPEK